MSTGIVVKIALGVILLSLGLLLFSAFTGEKKSSGVQDENHCPTCGREYTKGRMGDCAYCALENGGKGGKAKARGGPAGLTSGRTPYLLGGMIAFLVGGTAFLWVRTRKPRQPRHVESTYRHRCPHCKRKLGYTARKAGKQVLCPGCRRELTLPSVPV